MITLLGSLIGFISSLLPDLLKLFRDSQDRKHELTILQLQLEQQKQGQSERVEEIRIQADSANAQALYKTYVTGIHWVDALGGTVRPVLSYGFFALYFTIKCMLFAALDTNNPLPWQIAALWSDEDQALFAGIIAFYFGQRAVGKLRQ